MNLQLSLLIFFFTFFFFDNSYCQKNVVNDKSITFTLLYTSSRPLANNKIEPSKYIIQVNIAESKKKKFKYLNRKGWLKLLRNDQTNWTANLLLYEFYEKDAAEFFNIIKTKETWVSLKKDEDIKYWESHIH